MKKNESLSFGITDPDLIYLNQQNLGVIGEKKYLISSKWWRKWCDYTNYGNYLVPDTQMSRTNTEDGPQLTDHLESKQVSPFSVYEPPGIISNQ